MTHRGPEIHPALEEPADFAAIDYLIRRYTNTAATHRDMANYFAESAEEQQRLANYYTLMRNEWLGRLPIDNVVALTELPDVVA